jgi:hypothetical protein
MKKGVILHEKGRKLIVNKEAFFIKGMNWDYSPIGTNYTYSLWQQPEETIKAALDYDMSLLKKIGVNTLRIYSSIPPEWIAYIHQNYGIYTVLNHTFGRYGLTLKNQWVAHTDYGDSLAQTIILHEVEELARTYKNTPGLLLYLLGNENNYGLFWEGAETEDIPTNVANEVAKDLYRLFNKATLLIKSIDSEHPVSICNGDLGYLDLIVSECPDVDILGINIYRGISFTDAFETLKKQTNKPFMFTEFGADAFNSITQTEEQNEQAKYVLHNWQEIYLNADGLDFGGNCLGGFTFQFSDGWWKKGQTYNLDVHDSGASWTNGGYTYDFVAGQKNMSEEWFGVCAKGITHANGTYPLYPRVACYILQEVHQINPYQKGQTTKKLKSDFSKIQLNDAVQKALKNNTNQNK